MILTESMILFIFKTPTVESAFFYVYPCVLYEM